MEPAPLLFFGSILHLCCAAFCLLPRAQEQGQQQTLPLPCLRRLATWPVAGLRPLVAFHKEGYSPHTVHSSPSPAAWRLCLPHLGFPLGAVASFLWLAGLQALAARPPGWPCGQPC